MMTPMILVNAIYTIFDSFSAMNNDLGVRILDTLLRVAG